jgi:hypothetical protein
MDSHRPSKDARNHHGMQGRLTWARHHLSPNCSFRHFLFRYFSFSIPQIILGLSHICKEWYLSSLITTICTQFPNAAPALKDPHNNTTGRQFALWAQTTEVRTLLNIPRKAWSKRPCLLPFGVMQALVRFDALLQCTQTLLG